MNPSSSKSSYIKMQSKILENSDYECHLVEVIAPKSRNTPWKITIDSKQFSNERIRRLSIDQFYKIVTNDEQSFVNLCEQLPITLKKLIKEKKIKTVEEDNVLPELKAIEQDIAVSIYLLAFENHSGFNHYSETLLKQILTYLNSN